MLPLHPKAKIVHQDEFLLIVDKPSGVLTHPNQGRDKSALFDGAYDLTKECYGNQIFLTHRLDKETSGLLICAFNSKVANQIKQLFEQKLIEKEYHAWVFGIPSNPAGEWKHRLERTTGQRGMQVRAIPGAPNAFTKYKVIEKSQEAKLSLLSLSPTTGRTHQLRIQAAKCGLPIVGDPKYGDFGRNKEFRKKYSISRMLLHAHRISFVHPVQKKSVTHLAATPLDHFTAV